MALRSWIAYPLVGLSIALVATIYAVQVEMATFIDMKRTGAQRYVDALERELWNSSCTANDWASWDDAYQMRSGEPPINGRIRRSTLQ